MATDGEATEEETGDPEKFVIKIEVKIKTQAGFFLSRIRKVGWFPHYLKKTLFLRLHSSFSNITYTIVLKTK